MDIGTSVVSYLTAQPSREVLVAAYQEIAREWQRTISNGVELVASKPVVTEAKTSGANANIIHWEVGTYGL